MKEPKNDLKYLVLAESRKCYLKWCEDKDLEPNGPNVKHVTSTYHLRDQDPTKIAIFLVCDWKAPLTIVGYTHIVKYINRYKDKGTSVMEDRCE